MTIEQRVGTIGDSAVAALESCGATDLSALNAPPRISAAWLIVPCLVCDFLMMPAFALLRGGSGPSEMQAAFAFGVAGCVLAQGNLLAAWLAWSEGRFLRRLATHWKIAAGLFLGLVHAQVRLPQHPAP